MSENENLVHAVINQIDFDYSNSEFEPIGRLLINLLKIEGNKDIIIDYLGDTILEDYKKGEIKPIY
jgi:hypothetical protein